MKKLISLISALTMLSAVPMSASAEMSDLTEWEVSVVERIMNDLPSYDYNADGVTTLEDAQLVMEVYAGAQCGYIEINDDRTYTVLRDNYFDKFLTEEELIRVLETGNVTNPEWDPEKREEAFSESWIDGVDAVDATFILRAMIEYYGDGDVNTDGAVDALDASNVLTYYAKGQSGIYDEEYNASTDKLGAEYLGDYNADGAIDALDASDILAGYAAAQTA